MKAVKRTTSRGKRPKSEPVETEVEVVVEPPEPTLEKMRSEVVVVADSTAVELFEGAPELEKKDELRPDQDLVEVEKARFREILKGKFDLEERADKLVKLARMTGNKTAPVALRAIQMINEITGITEETQVDAPSMFTLPDGVSVSVEVKVPEK